MAIELINGDYKRSEENGQPLTVSYIEELLQNAFVALNVRRGRFYPDKNFGSKIRGLTETPLEEYAFAYACQALDGLDGVFVKSAEISEGAATLNLILNGTERQVSIDLENNI